MENIDPYEIIKNIKWKIKSENEIEQIKEEVIPSGANVQIIQKGMLITDNQGRLLTIYPDTKLLPDLLNHIWELCIIPEIEKRKKIGVPAPFPLDKFIVILDKENGPIVKFNNEYEFIAQISVKKGKINKGDPIIFDQIRDIITFDITPILKDGKPVAFLIFNFEGNQISVCFDFRPNDPSFNLDEWKDEGEWLAKFWLESLLASHYGHLMLVIPKLSENDIPFTIGPKSEIMKLLYENIEKGMRKKELDNVLSNITIDEIKSLIDNWLRLDLFSKRVNILREVLKSFNDGNYGGTVLLLMSQTEGIIMEELIKNKKGIDKNGKAKWWNVRMDEFYEVIKTEEIGPLTSHILEGTYHFLKCSNLYKEFKWRPIDKVQINRHACMHGKDVSFNTRANAIRMILLFDALYWIVLEISLSRSKKIDMRNLIMRWY